MKLRSGKYGNGKTEGSHFLFKLFLYVNDIVIWAGLLGRKNKFSWTILRLILDMIRYAFHWSYKRQIVIVS